MSEVGKPPAERRHDPRHVADLMWWVRAHYQQDHDQPRDLADFMARTAETLERCVDKRWRTIAIVGWLGLTLCLAWLVGRS